MPRRAKIVKEGRIEILNFTNASVSTFELGATTHRRLGATTVDQRRSGSSFEPSGVYVTIYLYEDGTQRLAREEVVSTRLLDPGILGVFTIFKRGNRAVDVLTAVRENEWDEFVRFS